VPLEDGLTLIANCIGTAVFEAADDDDADEEDDDDDEDGSEDDCDEDKRGNVATSFDGA